MEPGSTQPLPGVLEPLSNVFNPGADHGTGPLTRKALLSQIHLHIFFTRRIYVPGPSIPSNAEIHSWLNRDPEALTVLFRSGRLCPVFVDTEPDFSSAMQHRLAKKSAGIDHVDHQRLLDIAAHLDALIPEMPAPPRIIARHDLDLQKTTISTLILQVVRAIEPALAMFESELQQALKEEFAERGSISGTFWHRLPGKFSELRPFAGRLSQIGTLVFDLAHAHATGCSLAGHTYTLNSLELLSNQPAMGEKTSYEIELPQDPVVLKRDLPNVIDEAYLSTMSIEDAVEVDRQAALEKDLFHDAVRELVVTPSLDNIKQTKERFDEYVLSIAKNAQFAVPRRIVQEIERNRKLHSRVRILRQSETWLYSICAAVGAAGLEPAVAGMRGGYLLCVLAAGGLAVMKHQYPKAEARAYSLLSESDARLDRWRPISFTIPVREEAQTRKPKGTAKRSSG